MGTCIHHPDRETQYQCMKHQIYLCDECLQCKDPKIYCKHRSACPIWFMSKQQKRWDEFYGKCGHPLFHQQQKNHRQERPIIVDFWAPWCGPCKAMGPLFESLAESYGDQMIFAKCNVDDSQAVANRLGIKAIPTLKIFKDGLAVHSVTGMVSQSGLEEAIKKVLAGEETKNPFSVI